MLPAAARLRRREDFTLVVRRGRRAGRGALVVHYLPPPAVVVPRPAVARVGFVVGRTVGGSVDRHRVVRRLRHLIRDRLDRLPAGARLVVRALPPARLADSTALGRDLDGALDRLLGRRPTAAASAEPTDPPAAPRAAPAADSAGRPGPRAAGERAGVMPR